jgi:hypothetical protein
MHAHLVVACLFAPQFHDCKEFSTGNFSIQDMDFLRFVPFSNTSGFGLHFSCSRCAFLRE